MDLKIDLFGNVIEEEETYSFKEEKESPFVYMNYISKKSYPETFSGYSPFLTNLGFSQRADTVLYANELNKYHDLEDKAQFDFYFYALPKKNYFAKWAKNMKTEETEMIMEYFKVSYKVAKQYEKILLEPQLKQIKEWFKNRKGGK